MKPNRIPLKSQSWQIRIPIQSSGQTCPTKSTCQSLGWREISLRKSISFQYKSSKGIYGDRVAFRFKLEIISWLDHSSLFTNIKPECHLRNDQTLKQTTLLNFCYIITTSKSTICIVACFLTKQAMNHIMAHDILYIITKQMSNVFCWPSLYLKVRLLENIVDSIKWTLGITLRELKFDCFSYLTCCQGGRSKAAQPIPRLQQL